MMTGDKSLYIFGIPVIGGEETTQEENTDSAAPADDARALFESIDALLDNDRRAAAQFETVSPLFFQAIADIVLITDSPCITGSPCIADSLCITGSP